MGSVQLTQSLISGEKALTFQNPAFTFLILLNVIYVTTSSLLFDFLLRSGDQ